MAANGYAFRLATIEEAPILGAQRRAMFIDMGQGAAPDLDAMVPRFIEWVTEKMRAERYRTWLAIAPDGTVAAGAGLWLKERAPGPRGGGPYLGYILNVYCEPAHRRHGLARALMDQVLAWCRENDLNVAELHASEEGRPLYESLGFDATNEMRLGL